MAGTPAPSATPAVHQPDETKDEAGDADLQPRCVVARCKPVIGKGKDNRHQAEDRRPNRDDCQSVDIGRCYGRLNEEAVVLGRLLHVNHSNAAVGRHRLQG